MKARKYRLQTVLNVRNRAREEAARLVAVCLEQLAHVEAELSERELNLQACCEKQKEVQAVLNLALETGALAKSIITHRTFLKDLREQECDFKSLVEQQQVKVKQAETAVEAARQKLFEASKELKAIEIHKENWVTAERTGEHRREQKITDEIGSILHGNRENT